MKLIGRECTVVIDDSPEVRDAVFQRVVQFFQENDCWHEESVAQSDVVSQEGPQFAADLVALLEPQVEWIEE